LEGVVMKMVKLYQVKPSVESKQIWMTSGNKGLMEAYAREMHGVVVEREVVRLGATNKYDLR
jgi:putative IMPACT (imprinted ancient) family translation regulator